VKKNNEYLIIVKCGILKYFDNCGFELYANINVAFSNNNYTFQLIFFLPNKIAEINFAKPFDK
jgi:hypothetical protein